MSRRVWVDTDMGFDDLAAILTLAADPEIEIAGLSLVAGNARLEAVADNAARAAALFGWRMPIHQGRDRPLIGPLTTASYALGESGLPTVGRGLPDLRRDLSGVPALDALANFLTEEPEAEILALGPLSNLAVLCLARPDLLGNIAEFTWMGGSAGQGNHTAAAEFNAFVDPEAVAILLGSGVPFRMVGLDCCRQVTAVLGDVDPFRFIGSPKGDIVADLLEGYIRIPAADGTKPMALYDAVAAAALRDPMAVSFVPAHIEAERGGNAGRGATFVQKRVPDRAIANAEVAISADAERVRTLVFGALKDAAAKETVES